MDETKILVPAVVPDWVLVNLDTDIDFINSYDAWKELFLPRTIVWVTSTNVAALKNIQCGCEQKAVLKNEFLNLRSICIPWAINKENKNCNPLAAYIKSELKKFRNDYPKALIGEQFEQFLAIKGDMGETYCGANLEKFILNIYHNDEFDGGKYFQIKHSPWTIEAWDKLWRIAKQDLMQMTFLENNPPMGMLTEDTDYMRKWLSQWLLSSGRIPRILWSPRQYYGLIDIVARDIGADYWV